MLAFHSDGSVSSWGRSDAGGDSSAVDGLSNVILVVGAELVFAALKQNGDVVAWGDSSYGGTGVIYTSVTSIFASKGSFGVIKSSVQSSVGALMPMALPAVLVT